MNEQVNNLFDFLSTAAAEDIRVWLDSVTKDHYSGELIPYNRDSIWGCTETLVSILYNRRDEILERKICDAAVELLIGSMFKENNYSEISTFRNILFLVEALSCSPENRHKVEEFLFPLIVSKQYAVWINETADANIPRRILHAFASKMITTGNAKKWEEILSDELKNFKYVVSAFCILFRADHIYAVQNHLDRILKMLQANDLPTTYVLFDLAQIAYSDLNLLSIIKEILAKADMQKELEEFLEHIKYLKQKEIS